MLDQPEIQAFSVFDHRKWPPHKPMPLLLDEFGVPEVSLLLKQYHEFFEDTSLEEVLLQWAKLNPQTVVRSICSLGFLRYGARMQTDAHGCVYGLGVSSDNCSPLQRLSSGASG